MKKIIIILLISFLFFSCAGTHFKWDDARKIKEGMTIEEVTGIMGRPVRVVASGDVIRYIWVYVEGLTYATKSLSIDFKDDKVVKVPPIPKSFQD